MNSYQRRFAGYLVQHCVFAVSFSAAVFYASLSEAQRTKEPTKPVKTARAANSTRELAPPPAVVPTESPVSAAHPEMPFLYPDPRTVGIHPYIMQGHAPIAATPDRYAGVSEQERQARILHEKCMEEIEGFAVPKREPPKCPLCEKTPMTPCRPCGTCSKCKHDPYPPCGNCENCRNGKRDECLDVAQKNALPCENMCKMCAAGFPCERTLCRHDLQPRSKNMGNSCDLTAGDEPCGTCDACREHRSDPCEHADDGWDRRGQFNPYREPRLFSVIPRPILDLHNNGARKFPVYYNPAPYYRPTWNPSIMAGYARPFTFRWSCPVCNKEACDCAAKGLAGQVPYAYSCKFCNRNPCACAQDICNVTKPLTPKETASALDKMKNPPKPEPQAVPNGNSINYGDDDLTPPPAIEENKPQQPGGLDMPPPAPPTTGGV